MATARTAAQPASRIPTTEEEVDLEDLTWLGSLKTRREARAKNDPGLSLYTNRAAVWAVGMLAMSGLHWQEAAKCAGMTPATFRTVKSRCLVPIEPRRAKKVAKVFDQEVARETQRRGGFTLRRSLQGTGQEGPLEWFWVHKKDFATRFSPLRSPRRREHNEPRIVQEMSIVTRDVLDAERRMGLRPPFAGGHASVGA